MKKLIKVVAVVAFVMFAGYNVLKVQKTEAMSDIAIANVEALADDELATMYKIIKKATRIYCCSEALYYYVQRPNSIVHTINEKALRDIYLARSDCYYGVKGEFPEAEKYAMVNMAVSALNLYDRSLWAIVDRAVLEDATAFLRGNKAEIMKWCKSGWMQIYMNCPRIYKVLRLVKHLVGNVIRFLKK